MSSDRRRVLVSTLASVRPSFDGAVPARLRRERLASVLERVATAHLLFPVAIILCAVAGFFVGIAIHPLVLPLAALLAIVGLRTLTSTPGNLAFWLDAQPTDGASQ